MVFIKRMISHHSLQPVPFGATYHGEEFDADFYLCLLDAEDRVLEYWKTESTFANGHDLIAGTVKSSITRQAYRSI